MDTRAEVKAIRANIKQAKLKDSQRLQQQLVLPSKASPEEAATRLNHRCPHCGTLLIPRIETYEASGKQRQMFIWPDQHGCKQELKALKNQAIEQAVNELEMQEEARKAILTRAGLIGWLGRATFDTFEPRPDWPDGETCKVRVMKYADDLLNHRLTPNHLGPNNWLILYGQYGNGKSHLAASVVREALAKGWSTCYFRVWTEYLKRLQASWKPRPSTSSGRADDIDAETESDIVAELQDGRLVVIDDLDKKDPTVWTRGVLYGVLNYRYNAELPTILTFNFGPDDADPKAPGRLALEDYLGRASLDRLIGAACDLVEFGGPSFRSGVTWKRT